MSSGLAAMRRYVDHPAFAKAVEGIGHGDVLARVRTNLEANGTPLEMATVAVATWSNILIDGGAPVPPLTTGDAETLLVLACEAYLAARKELQQ